MAKKKKNLLDSAGKVVFAGLLSGYIGYGLNSSFDLCTVFRGDIDGYSVTYQEELPSLQGDGFSKNRMILKKRDISITLEDGIGETTIGRSYNPAFYRDVLESIIIAGDGWSKEYHMPKEPRVIDISTLEGQMAKETLDHYNSLYNGVRKKINDRLRKEGVKDMPLFYNQR